MEIGGDFMNKVKKRLSFFSSSTDSPSGEADFLLKMNLPPLMGRRDAAVDVFNSVMSIDFFEREPEERLKLYRDMLTLLREIGRDNESIVGILSSPDTILRERRISLFWRLLHDVVVGMESLLSTEIRIYIDSGEATGFFHQTKRAKNTPVFSEQNSGEIRLVSRLREIYDVGNVRLNRYREYAAKSFSKSNADRYKKAYEEYKIVYTSL